MPAQIHGPEPDTWRCMSGGGRNDKPDLLAADVNESSEFRNRLIKCAFAVDAVASRMWWEIEGCVVSGCSTQNDSGIEAPVETTLCQAMAVSEEPVLEHLAATS